MTKKDWLKRCENVYDLGFVDNLIIARNGTDFLMRSKVQEVIEDERCHQQDIVDSIMKEDIIRSKECLANDTDAYNALQAMHILTKQCQKCAESKTAWHCRGCSFGCDNN